MGTAGTIVVGVDSSESSLRALAWAVDQARVEDRALTLVHAADADAQERGQVLATARAEVRRKAPDLEVHEVCRSGDPREVLIELSSSAELVVVGSRGRGQLRSLLLGSVGVAVVRHAECPVVVHRPWNPGIVRRGVVVGADGSQDSRTVLEFAYRQAALHDLPLTVLHSFWDVQAAASSAAYIVEHTAPDLEAERLLLAESLAGMSQKYPDVRVHSELARGLPQEALVAVGERMHLIVAGAHRTGRLSRILFGSTAVSVVEHAHTPVAVVPLPAVD
jgi:nucleotide-binding universal stress UspA family protein